MLNTTSRKRRNSEPLHINAIPHSILEFLKQHKFFSSWKEDQLHKLCLEEITIHRYQAGDIIIEEDGFGKSLYLVISGIIECRNIKSDCIFTLLTQGSFFGEVGAIYSTKRTATCQVKSERATLARIEGSSMIKHFSNTPSDRLVIMEMAILAQLRYVKNRVAPIQQTSNSNTIYSFLQEEFPIIVQRLNKNSFPSSKDNFLSSSLLLKYPKNTIISFKNEDNNIRSFLLVDGVLSLNDCQITKAISSYNKGEIMISPYSHHGLLEYIRVESEMATIISLPTKILKQCLDCSSIEDSSSSSNLLQIPKENTFETPPPSPIIRKRRPSEQLVYQSVLPFCYKEKKLDKSSIGTLSLKDGEEELETLCGGGGTGGLSPLIGSKGPELEKLLLKNSTISGMTLRVSVNPNCHLKELELIGCHSIEGDDFIKFIDMSCCSSIERLNVSNTFFLKDSILLEISRKLKKLKEIDIGYSRNLSNRCWEVMPASIERLSIHRMIDRATSEPPLMNNLIFLDLSDCAFLECEGLSLLLERMPNLKEIILRHCTSLNDSLFKGIMLENLEVMDLSFCPRLIGHESLKKIIKKTPRLKRIVLRGGRYQNYEKIINIIIETLPCIEEITLSNKESSFSLVEGEDEDYGGSGGGGGSGGSSCYDSLSKLLIEKKVVVTFI